MVSNASFAAVPSTDFVCIKKTAGLQGWRPEKYLSSTSRLLETTMGSKGHQENCRQLHMGRLPEFYIRTHQQAVGESV